MVSDQREAGPEQQQRRLLHVPRAPRIISPQDGAGGTTPSPRKRQARFDDDRRAATASENCTSIGPAMLGRIVREQDARRARAERARRLDVFELRAPTAPRRRSTRAKPGTYSTDSTRISVPTPGPEQGDDQQRQQDRREAEHDVGRAAW